MSVIVKGMKMPTHCLDCPFMVSRDNDDCILQSEEANENFENWEQMKAGCPLITIPPHGRLIDADTFENFIRKDWDKNDHWIADVVYSRPTIIPADDKDINVPNKDGGE